MMILGSGLFRRPPCIRRLGSVTTTTDTSTNKCAKKTYQLDTKSNHKHNRNQNTATIQRTIVNIQLKYVTCTT